MSAASIRFTAVAFAYSDAAPVFGGVDLHLEPGFTGVVGANGAGKSTFLGLVAGALRPTAGTIAIEPAGALVVTCVQEVVAPPPDASIDAIGGKLAARLALDNDQLARWPTLSPGERRRWQLGAALAAAPDVLLLDEPTNHLDAAGRALIVRALEAYAGIGIVVAHDRALLDDLTRATLRVHDGRVERYPAPYTAAKHLWEAATARAVAERHAAKHVARRARDKLADARRTRDAADAGRHLGRHKKSPRDHDTAEFGAKNVASWAEARAGRGVEVARREAERAEAAVPLVEKAKALGRSVFVGYARSPRRFLYELEAPTLRAGGAVILRDVRVAVGAAARIRIAGANGAGKTTLLRALVRADDPQTLFLPQELPHDAGETLLAALRATPALVRGRTLQIVAALGVDPDRLLASMSPSPGEARKLALAFGLARHVWGVVLDEPTNHLDLPSIERLEVALAAFPGALVVVTHDDAFAARVATTTWRVAGGLVDAR